MSTIEKLREVILKMKKKNNMKNLTPYITLFLFIMVCLILVNFKGTKINEISYDEFMSFMNNDKIEKLNITKKESKIALFKIS